MSLCPWSITVSMGRCNDTSCFINHRFEVPALPAFDWLRYLLSEEPDLNSLINEVMPDLEDFYFENGLSIIDMYQTVLNIIEIASARPWWVALRLIYCASDNWHIVGSKLLMNRIDASVMSLAAWLDVALFIMIESMDPKEVTMFSLKLETAPTGGLFAVEKQPEPVMDRSSFLAMAR